MSKHPAALLLSAGALALGVAACGGSSSTSTAASSGAAAVTSSSPAATTGTSSSAGTGTSSSAGTGTSSSAGTGTSSSAAAAGTGGGGDLTLAANPSGQLMFTKKSLTAKAGTVTIKFTNHAPEQHNLTIQEGTDGPVVGATPTFTGGTRTLTVKLKPGTYTFYCSVPGHRMAGMQGTLTVS